MKITDVKIRKANSSKYPDLAYIVAITIDNQLIINDIRVYKRTDESYKIKLPNHPLSASHGVRNITTTTNEVFNNLKSVIIQKIKEDYNDNK